MTTILNEKITDIIFKDNFTCDECKVKVKLKHLKYENGNEYYDISYLYDVSRNNRAHPFYNILGSNADGAIVFKNKVTQSLTEYLFISDSELSSYSGTTTPMSYRKIIIKFLDSLSD